MKPLLKFFGWAAFCGLLIVNVHLSNARGQGTTAFTYQGRLLDNGLNAQGTNGMIFTLYSAATGGSALASPITNSVAVSNGVFTVNLDFGAGAFNGSARWLDIAVSNGVTNVELLPREQILPTPYATFAATAATASNFTGGAVSGSFSGNGVGLTNVAANLRMVVFPSPGTYLFTVPTNVSSLIVELWGGGGGGGAGNASYDCGGGGGGAGGYGKIAVSVTPGASYPVTVGGGGNGTVTGSGYTGGSSSFDNTLVIVTGGQGGAGGASTGVATGGAGGAGPVGSSSASGTAGGAGKYGTTGGGGDGGIAGVGGPGGLGSVENYAATAGKSPGGGGGGGGFSGSTSGATGATGELIIYY